MASLTLYHNPQCGTCVKATPLLEAEAEKKGFSLEKIEFRKNPPTSEQVEQILTYLGIGSGTAEEDSLIFKTFLRNDAPKASTVEEAKKIVADDPTLMQRPIVVNWAEKRAKVCRSLLAMPPPADDDFDFEDLDSLQLDPDEEAMLTGVDRGQSSKFGRDTSHHNLPYGKPNRLIDTVTNGPQSSTSAPKFSVSNASHAAKQAASMSDDFDDFGDLEDEALLLDENELLSESVPSAPPPRQASFQAAQPRQVEPQQRYQQPQPQASASAPIKLFSIFGGATHQTAHNSALQRTSSSSHLQIKGSLQRSSSSGSNHNSNINLQRQGSNVVASSSFFNNTNKAVALGIGALPQQGPHSSSHQVSNATNPFAASVIPRSDPSNDFAEDIFRSPESSRAPAESPTHHLIDRQAALTWQYPVNYPRRDYQYSIIRRALFTNTLVSLPTGLGKTFIAAVVMLNYFRWFPKSKIIFMAPTRPLVNQQIEACFKICGIPQDETIEMTGQQQAELRRELWLQKRVVFCTPQILQNDLKSGSCPAEAIVCLVIDEAHRATGRYAYTEVIRLLDPVNRDVRVMALTATPGSDTRSVQQVVQNLKITKIEMRTEDSLDLQRYVFKRTVQEIVVPCGREIADIRDRFHRLMRPFLDRLAKQNILRTTDPSQLTRFIILQGRDAFLAGHAQHSGTKAYVMKQTTICMGLIHAYELLTVHGIRPFAANMDPFASRSNSAADDTRAGSTASKRKKIEEEFERDDDKPSLARKAMEELPDFMRMMDSIRIKMKQSSFVSHPKIERLVGLVVQHFIDHQDESDAIIQARAESSTLAGDDNNNTPTQTRVMIFANYRESVEEITRVLGEHRPLIKVQSFIGQATAKGKKGITQKEQQKVVADFQKGEHNVLVATSIGEEGLDIGDVDLIICYDSHSSPIRMLQRMGRTGRKRKGKICLLLAEGTEEQKYRRSQTSYKAVQRAIAQGTNIQYYPHSPRILPPGPPPTCDLVHIDVPTYVMPSSSRKRKKVVAEGSGGRRRLGDDSAFLDSEELARFQQRYLLPKRGIRRITFASACAKLHSNKKRSVVVANTTFRIGHSSRTIDFISAVNGIAKSRVAQSLEGLTGRPETGDKDAHSKRMLALIERWGPSGTGDDGHDDGDDNGVETSVRAKRIRVATTLRESDSGPSKERRGAFSEDKEELNAHEHGDGTDDDDIGYSSIHPLFSAAKKRLALPKPRRKAAASTTAPLPLSTSSRVGGFHDSSATTSGATKSIMAYFPTISDDEVDLEIMGGFSDAFGHHIEEERYIAEASSDFENDHEVSEMVAKPSTVEHKAPAHHAELRKRTGYDFREPRTPPPLWYKSKEKSDIEIDEDVDIEAAVDGAELYVVRALPSVPKPGEWYQPATAASSQTDFRVNRHDKNGEEETVLFIESSEDEAEVDSEHIGRFKRASARLSTPPWENSAVGKDDINAFDHSDHDEQRHHENDTPQSDTHEKQRGHDMEDHGGRSDMDDFEFDELMLLDDTDLQEEDMSWE
ncbi:hypothetical protein BGZ99_002696 [Dissophora globulifera]|uniref:ATP-dependent DNA helicase n=1 Tax=Dissophora globulifera TaxID=979702 RepID=A0A9P6UXE6_9FUNG|nr:hypothetical protein BGZ99_002696 [Dissophora globulifera]